MGTEVAVLFRDAPLWERLRKSLIGSLRRIRPADREEVVHEALCRTVREIQKGTEVRDLDAFARSTAIHVWHEELRRLNKVRQLTQPTVAPTAAGDSELRARCLEWCLEACFTARERKLLREYYQYDGQYRIAHRKKLAAARKVDVKKLHVMVYQLRQRLQVCVNECLEEAGR